MYKRIVIVTILVALILLVIPFSAKHNQIIEMTDENGYITDVMIDLVSYRRGLLPDTLSGSIEISGKKYVSVSDTSSFSHDVSFIDIFSEPQSRTFVFFPEGQKVTDSSYEILLLSTSKYDFRNLSICISSNEGSEWYKTGSDR